MHKLISSFASKRSRLSNLVYYTTLIKFTKFIGKNQVNDINSDNINDYLTFLSYQKASGSTIRQKYAIIRSFLQYCTNQGEISINPAIKVDRPEFHQKQQHYKPMAEKDILIMLNAPDTRSRSGRRDKAIMELFYATGIRLSELVNLNVKDVELRAGLVSILHGKGDKYRQIPLHKGAIAAIRRHLTSNPSNEALFCNCRKKRITPRGVQLMLKKYLKKTKLDLSYSAHSFRHSFATHLHNNGASIRDIQALLGHANITTTQIYTHVSADHASKVINSFHPMVKGR